MLCFPNDPYSTENIFIHEFAHVIHGEAMRALDATFNPAALGVHECDGTWFVEGNLRGDESRRVLG